MGIYYSDNPDADFRRWEAEQQSWEDSLPHCERCHFPIDDQYFEIDDYVLCLDCVIEKYGRRV